MHSILVGAAAHHVMVLASSGDNGAFSDDWFGGRPVEEVELPASDPLVLGVGGTTLTAEPSGAYVSETAWAGGKAASATCTPVRPLKWRPRDLGDEGRARRGR